MASHRKSGTVGYDQRKSMRRSMATGTVDDGFKAGWHSVMGLTSLPPDRPDVTPPAGTPPYIFGFGQGVKAGNEQKAKSTH